MLYWKTGVLGKLYYVRFADEYSSGSVVVVSFRDSVSFVLSYGGKLCAKKIKYFLPHRLLLAA